jgi:RES domain-containing protein
MRVYRIASAGPEWDELDLEGRGARATGGRWNHKDAPALYASSSIALAVLETIVHINAGWFPLNRYVVEIDIPAAYFRRRLIVQPPPPEAWDSIPESFKTKDFGTDWVLGRSTLVMDVPSVIVPRERNVILNPLHAGMRQVKARNLGRFAYDTRLLKRIPARIP